MFWVNSTPHMNPRCFWKWLFYPPNWQHLFSPFRKRAWQFYKKWSWLLSMSKLVAENVPPTHTDGSPITLCIINYLDSIILIKFLCSILMTVERDHRDNPHPVMEIFFIFFLKLDHFLRTFCKKYIFTIENPNKLRKFFKNW